MYLGNKGTMFGYNYEVDDQKISKKWAKWETPAELAKLVKHGFYTFCSCFSFVCYWPVFDRVWNFREGSSTPLGIELIISNIIQKSFIVKKKFWKNSWNCNIKKVGLGISQTQIWISFTRQISEDKSLQSLNLSYFIC